MAADFNKPVLTDAYAAVLQSVRDLCKDLALCLDNTGTQNIPTGAVKWNSTNARFEKYNGTTWAALATTYAMSISGSAGSVPWSGVSGTPTTLSGYGITDALQVSPNKIAIDKSSTDLNLLTSVGFYRGSSMTNAPDAGWWFIIVQAHDNTANAAGWCSQIATAYGIGNTAGVVKKRQQSGAANTWSAWVTVYDSANFTPNATAQNNIGAAGNYGALTLLNNVGSWAGFRFGTGVGSDNRYFMSNGGQTGEYDTASSWQWRFDNGTLSVGTIPWARISGVPTYAGLSGPTFSEAYNTGWWRSQGAVGWYNQTYGGGIWMSDATWVQVYGSKNFKTDWHSLYSGGNIWTASYGWLHDRFANANPNANAAGARVSGNCGNKPSSSGWEIFNAGNGVLQTRSFTNNCTNCNCNCDCSC